MKLPKSQKSCKFGLIFLINHIFCIIFRYDEFKADEDKVVIGAGENGAPVHLYGQEKIMAEKLMSTEAFNIIASDQISMHRTVPGNF